MIPSLQWFDVGGKDVEGKGWQQTRRAFDRLPLRAKAKVPDAVWDLSRSATGMSIRFETDADQIHARWTVRSPALDEANMSRASFSGLDLYARDHRRRWRWVGVGASFERRRAQACLASEMEPRLREFLLYLPSRNPLAQLQVGVPVKAGFRLLPPRNNPVVYYGTSIVHGAFASRPGMIHSSILGRWLDRPVINLGFSGRARMEASVAQLLAEIDTDLFVIDPLPNMDAALVAERAETFLRVLCEARPASTVVLVEDFPRTNAWIKPAAQQAHQTKWRTFSAVYRKLLRAGYRNLRYVPGRDLLGNDNEGTLDGIHPNDVGYLRMAQALLPVLRAG